jgi:DNA-binding LacI/PurR family transcriptional regulator
LVVKILPAPRSNRVTIRDVAEMAQVSTATVSYVVNNRGRVSVATKEKVHAAMRLLDWKPDPGARLLASQHRQG